jgi:hypothetical protein
VTGDPQRGGPLAGVELRERDLIAGRSDRRATAVHETLLLHHRLELSRGCGAIGRRLHRPHRPVPCGGGGRPVVGCTHGGACTGGHATHACQHCARDIGAGLQCPTGSIPQLGRAAVASFRHSPAADSAWNARRRAVRAPSMIRVYPCGLAGRPRVVCLLARAIQSSPPEIGVRYSSHLRPGVRNCASLRKHCANRRRDLCAHLSSKEGA